MALFVMYQRPIWVVLGLVSLKGDCLWLGFVTPLPPVYCYSALLGAEFACLGLRSFYKACVFLVVWLP